MDLFTEIVGLLAVAAMIASPVICAVDGIKRAPAPYYDYVRSNKLSNTGFIYGIVGTALAGWSWYRYVTQPDSYGYQPDYTGGRLFGVIALGTITASIVASIFAFGGYWAGRGTYRASRALRQRILGSLSVEEQRSLAQTLPADILSAEVNQRLANGVQFTLSVEGQRSLVQTLLGNILSSEVLARIAAETLELGVEEQRSLAQALSADILSAEVLARIAAETLELSVKGQRSLAQALSADILSAEALARIDAGKLGTNEVRRFAMRAPRQSVIAAFCGLDNLSDSDLPSYSLRPLAKLFGLDRLVTMVSSVGADSLNDGELKKLADFLELDRLVDMVLIQIDTQTERSDTRRNAIDQQMRDLSSTLREYDGRAVELQDRLLSRFQADSELPDELRSVNRGSLTPDEVKRLKGMLFTDEERKELLDELIGALTLIAQSNARSDDLKRQRASEVRQQNILLRLRPATLRLQDLLVGYGTRQ